ncbi:MAG: phosphatase PAP2 family protein [Lachnospiraceae bacterium]|nr:phosphatase PAP2 family protein [Lachnospiraceae bacterium]
MNTDKNFIQKYKHALLPIAYFPVYMLAFTYLEANTPANYYIVHMKIDDSIPFCEYFIIPYLLWFFYIAAVVCTFIFLDKQDFYKLCITLGTGMTLFLLISFLIPNGHELRPVFFERDNIFVDMVKRLYAADTPTNLFPSIHCYNSIMAHIAIANSRKLKKYTKLRLASLILCTLIVLSTMFLKQHSAFDVITAAALSAIMYCLVYKPQLVKLHKLSGDFV